MSFQAILNRRLRSLLTISGITIGVAAVITFMTLGTSLQFAIVHQVSNQQPSAISVHTGPNGGQSYSPNHSSSTPFTDHDVRKMQSINGVKAAVPEAEIRVRGLQSNQQIMGYKSVTVTTPSYFKQVTNRKFESGRSFEPGTHEIVLNKIAATRFRKNVSVGDNVQLIRSDGEVVNVTVVGILASPDTVVNFDTQPEVYAPVNPFYDNHVKSPSEGATVHGYPRVTVIPTDPTQATVIHSRITRYLQTQSDAKKLKSPSDKFIVKTDDQFIRRLQRITKIFTGFITSVAFISLIVAMIGITNVMLVNVTERTDEIGILKAVGAQNRDILLLFLVESIIFGIIGAAGGTLLGALAGYTTTQYIGIKWIFPIQWVVIAIGVGISIGIVSGVYPAWRAARTDPIDALRHN